MWKAESSERKLRVVFCSTCMNRVEHVKQTLPRNLADNEDYEHAAFVLLDYGDRQGLGEWVRSSFEPELRNGRLIYFRNPAPRHFHMAHAKNMAHRCGMLEDADVLVNLDADNFTTKGFAAYLNESFAVHSGIFMRSKTGAGHGKRGLGGRIALRTEDYREVGGYDEVFDKWGPDDRDFALRVARLGRKQVDIDIAYLDRIAHSDELRVENYDGSVTSRDISRYMIEKDQRDPLAGRENILRTNMKNGYCHAGGGTVYRNFDPEPIRIESMAASGVEV